MPEPTPDPWLPQPDADGNIPAFEPGVAFGTFKVTHASGVVSAVRLLPNVACLFVEEHEGDTPATAVFQYIFADYGALNDPAGPQSVEQALSTTSTTTSLPDLVEAGDRLAVGAYRPDGTWEWVFDGFALAFGMTLNQDAEAVELNAVGVAKRCWDAPVGGAVMRDSSNPQSSAGDVPTDIVAQFNPRGVDNASPSTGLAGNVGRKYPIFLDPAVTGTDSNGVDYPRRWELPMAVAYLIYPNSTETYVKTPKSSDLDDLLIARKPIAGVPFDPNDASTYTSGVFAAPDTPLTGKPWPALVRQLIQDYGFGMRWRLASDANGYPQTYLELFLKQAPTPKPVFLQERGAQFRPALSNTKGAAVARDLTGVVNQWTVYGGRKRHEVSVVLYPGFPSQASDAATKASLAVYKKGDDGFESGSVRDAYRLWIADEGGEWHYLPLTTTKVTATVISLDAVFGAPSGSPPVGQYVHRRRPPIGTLFTLDSNARYRSAQLSISKAYAGPYGLWDGTATDWQHVGGGWELLKDRLGIWVNIQDPNAWTVGKKEGGPFASGVVKAVESIAAPSVANPTFFLRLTCVIEADKSISATSLIRTSSPLTTPITREVDARDRLVYHEIAAHSEFNNTSTPVVVRDDTPSCTAEATSLQTATEAGVMEGTLFLPRFTTYYRIGDRISGLQGRDLGFRTDSGPSGFAPVLPIVVSRRWQLQGRQGTTLHVSDAGLDRKRYGTRFAPSPGAATGSKTARTNAARNARLAKYLREDEQRWGKAGSGGGGE